MANIISSVRNKLTVQMVLWFAMIGLLPLFVATYFNYQYAANALNNVVSENLVAISQRQSKEIQSYFKNQEKLITILSLTSDVIHALAVLNRIENVSQGIKNNQISIEELRNQFIPVMKGIVDQFDFKQIYVVNNAGDISLSVGENASDYSNLLTGPLIGTPLAAVFEDTLLLMTPQISDFIVSEEAKDVNFYLASPVFSEGKLLGTIIVKIDASTIYEVTQNFVGLGNTGETVISAIVDNEMMILNPTRIQEKNEIVSKFATKKAIGEGMRRALSGKKGTGEVYDYRGIKVLAAWEYLPKMRWGLVVKIDKSETLIPAMQLRHMAILIGLGTLFVVLASAIIVSNSIIRPVIALKRIAELIASGDLTPKIRGVPSNEVGLLALSIATMARNLKSLVNQVKNAGGQVAATIEDVATTVSRQEEAALQTKATAMEIGASARKISMLAGELADTMQEVNEVAQDTALLAETGVDELQVMENSMDDLALANRAVTDEFNVIQDKAHSISSIVTTMTKVADQTNLLSLNATIEARRAGEFGRGFKVVANEIQRLSNQTAGATLEIEKTIRDMLQAVHNGVHAMEKLSAKVKYGVKEITTVSDHLGNVIQQVQGLPPRFEIVLQGMQAQTVRAESIRESIVQMNESAYTTIASLGTTKNKLNVLRKTAGILQNEISKFQT